MKPPTRHIVYTVYTVYTNKLSFIPLHAQPTSLPLDLQHGFLPDDELMMGPLGDSGAVVLREASPQQDLWRITIPQLMVSGLQFEAQKLHQMKSQ